MPSSAACGASNTEAALLASIERRLATLRLDLKGLTVVTEAATGAYACAAILAARAGARARVFARPSRHGTAAEAVAATRRLARSAGVADRIEPLETLGPEALADCDILTNSGHVRPITAEMVAALPARAVIALMFETWEFRAADLDLAACRARGIRVAGVNERHPEVAVFPFLGPLCLKLLEEGGVPVRGRRVAVICDNPFEPFLRAGLVAAGAEPVTYPAPERMPAGAWDAVLLALDPTRGPPLGARALAHLAAHAPGAPLAQFWGDLDREAAGELGLRLLPDRAPAPGHMGILLNALGPEPIVRLQCGGLKAAEIVFRGGPPAPGGVAELL